MGFQKSLQRSNNRKALTMHLQTLAAYALEVSFSNRGWRPEDPGYLS